MVRKQTTKNLKGGFKMNTLQHVHIYTTAEYISKYAHRLWYIDPKNTINYKEERATILKCLKDNLQELRHALRILENGGDKND